MKKMFFFYFCHSGQNYCIIPQQNIVLTNINITQTETIEDKTKIELC